MGSDVSRGRDSHQTLGPLVSRSEVLSGPYWLSSQGDLPAGGSSVVGERNKPGIKIGKCFKEQKGPKEKGETFLFKPSPLVHILCN